MNARASRHPGGDARRPAARGRRRGSRVSHAPASGPGIDGARLPAAVRAGQRRQPVARRKPGRGAWWPTSGFVLREATTAGRRVKVACFGAVFTVPEHQGRGRGQPGVRRRHRPRPLARAPTWRLVSGARGLYQRAGFFPYPPCLRYRVEGARGRSAGGAPPARPVPYGPSALEDVMALQAAEPVRFERSVEDWSRLLAARHPVLFAGAALRHRARGPARWPTPPWPAWRPPKRPCRPGGCSRWPATGRPSPRPPPP